MSKITLDRDVVEQALEAADAFYSHYKRNVFSGCVPSEVLYFSAARASLRAALEKPVEQDESAYQRGVTAGRHEIASEYPLPADLYDSKDWRCGTYAERVEWLHTMYEDAKEQIAALEQPVEQERCRLCDCTGDIHGLDGEWRGECPYCRPQPTREPLTEMEIVNLRQLTPGTLDVQFVKFARAIEAAHGIKEQK